MHPDTTYGDAVTMNANEVRKMERKLRIECWLNLPIIFTIPIPFGPLTSLDWRGSRLETCVKICRKAMEVVDEK